MGNNGSCLLNIYCSPNLEEGPATETVLIGTVIGLATFFVTVATQSSEDLHQISRNFQ